MEESRKLSIPESGLSREELVGRIRSEWGKLNNSFEMGTFYDPCFKPDTDSLTDRQDVLEQCLITGESYENYQRILAVPPPGVLSGLSVLNIGAGDSNLRPVLEANGVKYIEVDPNFGKRIDVVVDNKKTFDCLGDNLPFGNRSMDEVFLLNVSQVVPDPRNVLEEVMRVARGRVRIFPVVCFQDLRSLKTSHGIQFLRRGVDYFTVVLDIEDDDVKADQVVNFLMQPGVFCFKPDDQTRGRRAKGYYYDVEYDLPEDMWCLDK